MFSALDILYLEEYCSVMSPIAETLDFLQREQNLTFGCLIPSLVSLNVKLKKISQQANLKLLKGAVTDLETKLHERFQPYFNFEPEAYDAVIAAVLSPRIKMKWFDAFTRLTNNNICPEDVHKIVLTSMRNNFDGSQEIEDPSFAIIENDFYDFDLGLYLIFV